MQFIETSAYQKAFIQYLRRDTPLELSLKAMAEERPITYYQQWQDIFVGQST